jgi:hypothetical protein
VKRFEDILRLISGVLLGTLVRDFDTLRMNLADLFSVTKPHFDVVAIGRATTVVLIAAFLRNIHGSAQYDQATEDMKVRPEFERTHRGRIFTFLFSLAALFGGPALIGHVVANHSVAKSSNTQLTVMPLLSGEWFFVLMFFPFGVYIVWDALLWIWGEDTQETAIGPVLENWIWIDCLGLFVFIGFIGFELYQRGKGIPFNYELAALAYLAISSFIILADYCTNRSFYFPELSSPPSIASSANGASVERR